jgi:hypothetical protein
VAVWLWRRDVNPVVKSLVGCLLVAVALSGCGCPTTNMPCAAGWGTPVIVSIPELVAREALLAEAVAVPQPDKVIQNADGSTTTMPQPAVLPVPVRTITATDATGAIVENICVLVSEKQAVALCNGHCCGTNGWPGTVWGRYVHTLKTCPFLAVMTRSVGLLVMGYIKSESTFRSDYFADSHSKFKGKSKVTGDKCKGDHHVFGTNDGNAEVAITYIVPAVAWWK